MSAKTGIGTEVRVKPGYDAFLRVNEDWPRRVNYKAIATQFTTTTRVKSSFLYAIQNVNVIQGQG